MRTPEKHRGGKEESELVNIGATQTDLAFVQGVWLGNVHALSSGSASPLRLANGASTSRNRAGSVVTIRVGCCRCCID